MWRRYLQVCALVVAWWLPGGFAFASDAARASDAWVTVVEAAPKDFFYEAWAGGDGGGRSMSVYGGMTSSLSGDIRGDGFRLRSAGAYGTYAYTRSYAVDGRKAWQDFAGTMWSTDLMLGYQAAAGLWIVKAFVGASQETHVVRPRGGDGLAVDTENAVQGDRLGFKGSLETWLNIDNIAFLQTDLSWSSAFKAYGGRVRTGYRLNPALSTGLEAGIHGNVNHDAGRAGAFLRFEWTGGEVSASAGAAGNHHDVTGIYGSLGLMIRF